MHNQRLQTVVICLLMAALAVSGCNLPEPPIATATSLPRPAVTIVPMDTQSPQNIGSISAANINKLVEARRWGNGSLQHAVYSSNGQKIATASSIGLYVYDAQTLQQIIFMPTSAKVNFVTFSPDDTRLAAALEDGSVILWDADHAAQLQTFKGHTRPVNCVAFTPGGKLLASGSRDGSIILWDLASGASIRTLKSNGDLAIMSVAFSPDGSLLASGGSYNRSSVARLWDWANGTELMTLKTDHTGSGGGPAATSLAFSKDGRTLAVGGGQSVPSVTLWDVASGNLFRTLRWQVPQGLKQNSSVIIRVALSPNGTSLISTWGDDPRHALMLWDIPSGEQVSVINGHAYPVLGVAFSPDGKTIASASQDGALILWNSATQAQIGNLDGQMVSGESYGSNTLAFSRDGKTLAAGQADNTIKLWDLQNGKLVQTLSGSTSRAESVATSADGKLLAAGMDDGSVNLWDLSSGVLLRSLSGNTNIVMSVTFSADGKLLASGGDSVIRIWNPQTGELLHSFDTQIAQVFAVAFSPDGKTLASASYETVTLWDVTSGRQLQSFKDHILAVSVAFSPDGQKLASGDGYNNDPHLTLWDIHSGQLLYTLKGSGSVAFSPDGAILISGSDDNTVKLWDVKTGELLRALSGHTGPVPAVALSPDNRIIASASTDETIRLWAVRP